MPKLYSRQRAFVESPARYVVVEASTKSGKTVGMLVWLLRQAWEKGRPGREYWWVAPVYPQAEIAYRRLARWLQRAATAAGVDLCTTNETKLRIQLLNGATVVFRSGEKPDNLYGEDVWAAVLDEASRMREEAWFAIRSTLTKTRGPVRIIGNVKGRRNWAYVLARKAEAGEPGWEHHRLTAHDAVEGGVLDAEEIEAARSQLPEAVFNELYLAIPSDDGSNPFGLHHIAACVGPLSSRPASVFGWDLAKSHDWTVGIGLDSRGRTAVFERFQLSWEVTTPRIMTATGHAPALVDATGVGDPIVERLRREGGGNFQGYVLSGPSKQRLMEGLAAAIQHHEVSFPDGPIRNELESFEYVISPRGNVGYSAPEGMHDDCVIALGLAVQHYQRFGGDDEEMSWSMGVYRCACGHMAVWAASRPCPNCGQAMPAEYGNPTGEVEEVEAGEW